MITITIHMLIEDKAWLVMEISFTRHITHYITKVTYECWKEDGDVYLSLLEKPFHQRTMVGGSEGTYLY